MGATTDKILGRAKQAFGPIAGNKKIKREGQLEEGKGELKEQVRLKDRQAAGRTRGSEGHDQPHTNY